MREHDENMERLARVERLIEELASECRRSAELREDLKKLRRKIDALVQPVSFPKS